jgi:hypothetical protein
MDKPCGESGRPGPSGDGNREPERLYHLFQLRARIFFCEVKIAPLRQYLSTMTLIANDLDAILTRWKRSGLAVIRSE